MSIRLRCDLNRCGGILKYKYFGLYDDECRRGCAVALLISAEDEYDGWCSWPLSKLTVLSSTFYDTYMFTAPSSVGDEPFVFSSFTNIVFFMYSLCCQ